MKSETIASVVAQLEAASGGQIAFALHDLTDGTRLGHRGDVLVPTASVIKLPIMLQLALSVDEGALSWEQTLDLDDAVKVAGSGILKELSAGLRLTLRDTCVLMMALSDNTATNMLIDVSSIAAINARMAALGCPQTRLLRRAFTPDTPASRPFGLGVTTANETADLLVRLASRTIGSPASAALMLDILAMQQDHGALPRMLPGWTYAGKTGAVDHVRSDAAILSGPSGRQYVLAAFCTDLPSIDWSADNAGQLALARLAHTLLIDTSPQG